MCVCPSIFPSPRFTSRYLQYLYTVQCTVNSVQCLFLSCMCSISRLFISCVSVSCLLTFYEAFFLSIHLLHSRFLTFNSLSVLVFSFYQHPPSIHLLFSGFLSFHSLLSVYSSSVVYTHFLFIHLLSTL